MANAAEQALKVTAQEFRAYGLAVEIRVQFGSAVQAILDTAAAAKPDLIVVGTHGRRGPARLFLGSCAEEVVRDSHARRSSPGADAAAVDRWDQSAPLGLTIVTDGARACESAFYWVRTSGVTDANKVSLVQLIGRPTRPPTTASTIPGIQDGHPELLRLLERDLRRDARSLIGASAPAMRFTVARHDAGEAIRDDVRQLGADAVVLGVPAHRRGTSTGLKVASVLRSSPVPVFCIPEKPRPMGQHISPIRTVLIPCDLSETSLAGVLPAYGLFSFGADGRSFSTFTLVRRAPPRQAVSLLARPSHTTNARPSKRACAPRCPPRRPSTASRPTYRWSRAIPPSKPFSRPPNAATSMSSPSAPTAGPA